MSDDLARRTVLRRLAVVGSVGVAGCSGETTTPTTSAPTSTASDTPTDSPTPSPTDEQPTETDTPERSCPDPSEASPRWRRETDDRNFDPVVRDGTVYFGTGGRTRRLRAVSLADGSVLWRTRADGILYAPPTVDADSLYYTNYGHVTAFARRDGTERWRHETTGDVPEPAVADDGLVVFGESNHPTPQTTVDDQFDRVVALNSDGTVRWRTRYAPEERAPLSIQPVVSEGTAITATEDFKARAFDPDDGTIFWTSGVSEPSDSVVIDAGGTDAVAFASRGGVETLRVSDGRTLWRDRIGVERVTVGGSRVFAVSEDELRALDASDGTLLWSREEFGGRLAGLTADDSRLLVSVEFEDGTLRLAELARDTGCVTRSFETVGQRLSPPALGENLAVVSTGIEDESVYAVETGGN